MTTSNNDISLGNILQHFPEFLIQILPCIADRTVFNSIASCNRDTHEKSKAILPPWPKDYQLPTSDVVSFAVWSPDGTRVAYTGRHVITIVDQRHGIIHRINHVVDICDLKFSSDGRFLVSVDDDYIVKLWDNNVAGNYGLLREWNVRKDIGGIFRPCVIDISACSKYIVVATYAGNLVVIKRDEDGETVRSLTLQPGMQCKTVMFSVDYRAVFICGCCGNSSVIKLWRPYQDDADEDSLITLWEQWEQKELYYNTRIIVSHDKMMIAIQYTSLNKGWLFSIDNNYSCTAQELNVPGSDASDLLQFTPDDECIIYATKKGLKYWSVAERKFIDNEYLIYNKIAMNNLMVMNCSPNSRQLIVYEDDEKNNLPLCIKSIS